MKYVCIRACYHKSQLWAIGDTLVTDVEKSPHFKEVVEQASKKDDTEESAPVVSPDDGEASPVKLRVVKLCAKNGINVGPDATVKEMKALLKDKGVMVN